MNSLMAKWKILVADTLEKNGLALLNQAAQADDCAGINADELLRIIPGYHALIVRSRTRVTAELFRAADKLRVIGRAGVGVDNIDLEAAREAKVAVVNTPAATSLAVAELTIGLMIALARGIVRADHAMKDGHWIKKNLPGDEINGKTLGLIGIGNIGALVAERATCLGLNVLAHDTGLDTNAIARRGARLATLPELYTQSDYISIHVPLTTYTRGMVDARAMSLMKPGVRLICTARGGIIDETALLAAIQSGQVAAAALDVFAQEPPGQSSLIAHPNIIATPHIGAQTHQAQERTAQDLAHEVLAALRGEPLRWRIV